MEDEAGLDEKTIAVPSTRLTKRYGAIKSYTDLPEISIRQVTHFSSTTKTWKMRNGSRLRVGAGIDDAYRLIIEASERAKNSKI
jgi:inorganic pyrophosphatase